MSAVPLGLSADRMSRSTAAITRYHSDIGFTYSLPRPPSAIVRSGRLQQALGSTAEAAPRLKHRMGGLRE
eukprot:CAMPEP_0206046350 /NCGR_PEP_ID=MMETSP1466-20131121/18377_1 /ASSEMBLY_ACC=CAM_ASM_001126 /TAXON_ID=44452 /ORGANISM="Pavlova gyrans, Strain CCMP608" /LENGTH=69 /DNA_ID=CAMNT_0053421323 /DNA_START=1 /DNA_END=207 /DNA_ORIENTATION=+